MKVADVMTRGIDFVDPSATVQAAATQMAELDVGAVLVGSETDGVRGILTDRDILVRVVVEAKNPSYVTVAEVMSPDVIGCAADDPIEAAFVTMRERQFRRMPVHDDDGKPIGIVTLGDLANHIEGPEAIAEKLRAISEPHRSRTAPDKSETEAGAEAEPTAAQA